MKIVCDEKCKGIHGLIVEHNDLSSAIKYRDKMIKKGYLPSLAFPSRKDNSYMTYLSKKL